MRVTNFLKALLSPLVSKLRGRYRLGVVLALNSVKGLNLGYYGTGK